MQKAGRESMAAYWIDIAPPRDSPMVPTSPPGPVRMKAHSTTRSQIVFFIISKCGVLPAAGTMIPQVIEEHIETQ